MFDIFLLITICLLIFPASLAKDQPLTGGCCAAVLSTTDATLHDDLKPYVGNGHVAVRLDAPYMFLSNVYSGLGGGLETTNPNASRIARVPNPFRGAQVSTSVTGTGTKNFDLARELDFLRLDTSRAVVERRWKGVPAMEQLFASRDEDSILAYRVQSLSTKSKLCVTFVYPTPLSSPEIEFEEIRHAKASEHDASGVYVEYLATVRITEVPWAARQPNQFTLILPRAATHCLSTSSSETWLNFYVAVGMQWEDFIVEYVGGYGGTTTPPVAPASQVLTYHVARWRALTHNRGIRLQFKDAKDQWLQDAIDSTTYYLLSSLSDRRNVSISPGTLSSSVFGGHVMWDAEMWVFPSLMPFWPSIARRMLYYRLDTARGARENAKKNGYDGIMVPWESASYGVETSPLSEKKGLMENHVSGDVVFAIRQLERAHGFLSGLEERDFTAFVTGVAEFWNSRVSQEGKKSGYDIVGVMGPDEFAVNVTNDAYTNAVAQISLDYAVDLTARIQQPHPEWTQVAKGLRFPKNSTLGIDLEYEGYTGSEILQADVVLLQYPLNWAGLTTSRRPNLEYYGPRVSPDSSTMTWSVHAINYLELDLVELGFNMFQKSYDEVSGPFNVWRRKGDPFGLTNDVSAGSAYLQAVLYGIAGLRIHSGYYSLRPRIPTPIEKVSLYRLPYQGYIISLEMTQKGDVTFLVESGFGVYLCYNDDKNMIELRQHERFTFSHGGSLIKFSPNPCMKPVLPPWALFLIIFVVCLLVLIGFFVLFGLVATCYSKAIAKRRSAKYKSLNEGSPHTGDVPTTIDAIDTFD